jgi:hypothetical protein
MGFLAMSRDVAATMEASEFAHILSTKRPEKYLSPRSIATSSMSTCAAARLTSSKPCENHHVHEVTRLIAITTTITDLIVCIRGAALRKKCLHKRLR